MLFLFLFLPDTELESDRPERVEINQYSLPAQGEWQQYLTQATQIE
jgi:hypothetical protein